jgi:photosystem II stability/assembly factor-like uncharacterized protein
MGGRIDDIAVNERDPSTYYLGYATGGIWKTTNNGVTFASVFDGYPVSSIGDIALAPSNPSVVYVGTGEANNRQSSSFGNGMYKSTDAGRTFAHIGLTDTQSIARVVVHPRNPDVVYVAAVGHLFGPNEERGLFKTADGGKTWTRSKYIDADTGFTDVVMDPSNPDVLYAASYQRRRVPYGFNGGGPGSAIWKTTDAGRSWTKLTGAGLPAGLLGRIGLDVSRSNSNVVYAQIEVGASAGTGGNVTAEGKPSQPSPFGGFDPAALRGQRPGQKPPPPDPKKSGVWRSDDGGRTWRVMSNNNNRPMYYSQIRVDPANPDIVYTMGAPFYKSIDGGREFKVVQGIAHSDHHALWIDPRDTRHLILGNDGGLDVSYDQGETWEFINTMAVGQFYAISADMRTPYFVCGGLQDNGSWCGPSQTRSANGILNEDWYRVGGGDGFYTQNDPEDHRIMFAESQDGNVNRVDFREGRPQNIRPRAAPAPRARQEAASSPADAGARPAAAGREDVATPPTQPPAGESRSEEQAAASPEQTKQMEELRAFMERIGREMGFVPPADANILPEPPPGERYRFFWNTPTVLSPHNPAVMYIGGNRLFISRDRGRTFTMTPDLTRDIDRFTLPIMGVPGDAPMASKHDGAGSFSHIVTVAESPSIPGVIWVGTNDGNVQVSRDGGATWKNVVSAIPGVPDGTHVSRVEPSHFDGGTCYVTFDNHRVDDHKPYVFVTRDYGESWTSLAAGLPAGNANVIAEDPKNRNLLYLGTEYAFFVSLDGGRSWKRFMNGLPTVRIDDVLVHPRDNDLILGTHGRSIWILDDISPLQRLSDEALKADVHVFEPRPAVQWKTDIQLQRGTGGAKFFEGENPEPGAAIDYLLKAPVAGDVKITVTDVVGRTVREMFGTNEAGLNRVYWTLRGSPPSIPPKLGDMLESMGMAGAKQMLAPQRPGERRPPPPGGGGLPRMLRQIIEGRPVDPGTYVVKVDAGGRTLTTTVSVVADEPY